MDELKELLGASGRDCLVVDARPRKEFLRGHIPGAVHIPWEEWNEKAPNEVRPILRQPGYWGKLASPDSFDFSHRLQNLGLDRDTPVVVYADGQKSVGREGRIAWMLLYLGARNVSILDGGLKAWKGQKLPLEREVSTKPSTSFQIELAPQRRMLHEDLVDSIGTDSFPTMIDTRTVREHTGQVFWYQPKKGCIPESKLLIYKSIFQKDGFNFVDQETYKSLLPDNYESLKNIAGYCEVGVRVCTVALLHEHYTGQVMPVYDGSIMEWSFDDKLPVLTADQINEINEVETSGKYPKPDPTDTGRIEY